MNTTIVASQEVIVAIMDIADTGKKPWIVEDNGIVQLAFATRGAAREAKAATGASGPVRQLETEGMDLRLAEQGEDASPEVAGPVDAEAEAEADRQLERQLNEEAGDSVAAPKTGAPVNVKRKSDIERPTKTVWAIAEELRAADPEIRRKDIIAECVRRGIAFYTARTQLQSYLAAVKASSQG